MNEEKYVPTMVTMHEAAAKTGLSFYAVRQMYLNNEVAYFKSGRKVYINLDDLSRRLSQSPTSCEAVSV